jgi:agmatine deiminase
VAEQTPLVRSDRGRSLAVGMGAPENNPQMTSNAAVYVSSLLGRRHPSLFRQIVKVLRRAGMGVARLPNTRDIWARDYMPIQRHDGVLVSYTYDPDYLCCAHRRLITDWKNAMPLHPPEVVNCGLVLDGGNVLLHGRTAIVTDKIFTENPQLSRRQVESRLREAFELDKLVIIPVEPGDIFGHADGMVAWIGPDRVLMNTYRKIDPGFHRGLKSVLNRARLEMVEVPYVPDMRPREIPSASGTYTNLLILPGIVLLPVYGRREDEVAMCRVKAEYPGQNLTPLNAATVAREGGSLHSPLCVMACHAKAISWNNRS